MGPISKFSFSQTEHITRRYRWTQSHLCKYASDHKQNGTPLRTQHFLGSFSIPFHVVYDPFCSFKNHWLDRNTYSTVNQNLLMEDFLTNCKFSLLTFSRNQVLWWFPINHQGEEPLASIRITWTWQLFISTCDKDYTLIEKIWTWNWTLLCQCNGEEKGIMRVYWRICRELNIVLEKQAALNFTSSNQLSLLSIGYCCR